MGVPHGQADVRGHHVAVLCSNEAAVTAGELLQDAGHIHCIHTYEYVNTTIYWLVVWIIFHFPIDWG